MTLPALDELLFELPDLVDFTVAMTRGERPTRLAVVAFTVHREDHELARAVEAALRSMPAIHAMASAGELTISVAAASLAQWRGSELRKRSIMLGRHRRLAK